MIVILRKLLGSVSFSTNLRIWKLYLKYLKLLCFWKSRKYQLTTRICFYIFLQFLLLVKSIKNDRVSKAFITHFIISTQKKKFRTSQRIQHAKMQISICFYILNISLTLFHLAKRTVQKYLGMSNSRLYKHTTVR